MSCRIGDLGSKEVINVCNGKRYGCVVDVELDVFNGRLCAIIVPGNNKLISFSKNDLRIPWKCIECIGDDTILVRIEDESVCVECERKEKRR